MSTTSHPSSHPTHLDPSELGTKEYWDKYYQNDLDNDDSEDAEQEGDDEAGAPEPPDPSDLESWFDDVGAPAKTLEFLTSDSFPLSPNYTGNNGAAPTVLDLGTGNGSALFSLRLEGGYAGCMVGVDYSFQSVELARKLCRQYFPASDSSSPASDGGDGRDGRDGRITFEVLDLINDNPTTQPWWPRDAEGAPSAFDLVLDKGTFDAISLSSSTTTEPSTGQDRRICELYPSRVLDMVKPHGFLLVTSCNWTEDEVVSWFTGAGATGSGSANGTGKFEVYGRIRYPVFEFGGQKGQGVASVCFRKTTGTS
ncbi:Protein-lysine N-methyltransferase efm4 [Exophiala xenobiotica]|nr:Protein-lysine N-methyltransferase efm4 [Exophiala xenobiotica]KAK5206072.1 Protein-lysine N-methyltransferase efm4 [Exophiala xenobiotica]KAK5229448.1 Protein-lysine N-methyltransferase efm4 [Exophiala xenobiotica]KAK5259779.1 Protein-lysine N-methyltransferase efm4 [Exophiala xenobiotica]KAK5271236.1 Protein-lysine N-methyltransferase efm4 [Exophiala xenobiotica]